jgi:hypothetical protein
MKEEVATMTVQGLLTDVGTVISTVVTTLAGNPLLAVFVGLGLLSAGAVAFRRLCKSAK